MKKTSLSYNLATYYRDLMPEIIQRSSETGRETVQAVVWVVGLSGTLLVFIATNPAFISGLPHFARILLCVSLGSTAFFGVLQRLVYRISEMKVVTQMQDLKLILISLTSEFSALLPLQDDWDRDRIIKSLENLPRNYGDVSDGVSVLRTADVPIEEWRKIYNVLYEEFLKREQTSNENLFRIMAAYQNKSEEKTVQPNQAKSIEDALKPVRQTSKVVGRWVLGSMVLFYATCISFMLSVVGLTIAAIIKAK